LRVPGSFLVLNTAEDRLQVAVAVTTAGGRKTEAWAERRAESRGAELLAPLIREVTAKARIAPAELGGTAAVRGPGRFTGLRLAAATAAGLARSAGTLTAGLEYLPLLAASVLLRDAQAEDTRTGGICAATGECADGLSRAYGSRASTPCRQLARLRSGGISRARRLWVLVHARKTLLYVQVFDAAGDASEFGPERSGEGCGERGPSGLSEDAAPCAVAPDGDIRLLTPEEAAAEIGAEARQGGPRPELVGSGVRNNPAAFAACLDLPGTADRAAPALLLPPAYDDPAPEALLLAATRAEWSREDIVPRYFRPPEAEENLAAVARALGLDPEAAETRLARLRASLP
jgi:tRNA threonylcarbamoyl adenosine modification protein YeaZ